MRVPIYAFTNHSQTRRRMALNRAVYAYRTAFSSDPEKTLQRAFTVLRQRDGLQPGAKLVVISDVLADQPADAIQIRKLGDLADQVELVSDQSGEDQAQTDEN
jgi:pyruvate kinase